MFLQENALYYSYQCYLGGPLPLLYGIQNSVISIGLIGVILFYVSGQGGKRQAQDSLFVSLITTALVINILTLCVTLFSGRQFQYAQALVTASAFLLLFFNPMIGAFYFLYIDQLRKHWERVPHRIGLLTLIPFLFNAFFVILSLFNGMVFFVDETNTYVRGEFFFLVAICNFLYFIGGQFHLALRKKDFKKVSNSILIHYPFPIIFAALLQMHLPVLNILNVAMSLTFLLVFLKMQQTQANRDFLTSLYNRSLCEQYLQHLFMHKRPGVFVGGILLDIDRFKEINDTYGHDMGDRALRVFAKMLKDSVSKDWLIGRYGGDEFMLLAEIASLEDMLKAVDALHSGLAHLNSSQVLPLPLCLSIGSGFDEETPEGDPLSFVKLLDERMYEDKRAHREDDLPLKP